MTLSLGTAYRSFGGEVEALSTPTICRLPDSRRHQLWAIAPVPTIFPLSDYVAAGGLISYGANLSESWRQTGIYVGKIVKGVKTTDLPIEQSATFELVINLKTAKALR